MWREFVSVAIIFTFTCLYFFILVVCIGFNNSFLLLHKSICVLLATMMHVLVIQLRSPNNMSYFNSDNITLNRLTIIFIRKWNKTNFCYQNRSIIYPTLYGFEYDRVGSIRHSTIDVETTFMQLLPSMIRLCTWFPQQTTI